ncbi:MAG: DUF1028 domain-containing protein [Actinobacteria bacterium]|nr:MAG: DUF1028 domain-containing protein [Actinomycetota bacterium]
MRRGTYSIVAHDHGTGECGVAVQSHWFSVGSVVTWGRAGVGAVATQSLADPAYGPRLLEALAAGEEPQAALDRLVAADPQGRFRQVAVVSAKGAVAVHTGDGCIAYAGHRTGERFSAQANMMANGTVWGAMADAFEAAEGSLARRLMAALDGAEAAGGDARGRQSAALLVVPAQGEEWHRTELRVEDHPEPLEELRRVLTVREAYDLAEKADEAMGEGRHEDAARYGAEALALSPENHEFMFWAGLGMAQAGDMDDALAMVRRAIELQPGWAELLGRLDPEIAPGAAAVLAELQGAEARSEERAG